jgi:hypothetical protein
VFGIKDVSDYAGSSQNQLFSMPVKTKFMIGHENSEQFYV